MKYDLINRAELPTVRIEIPKRLDDETCRIIEGIVKAVLAAIDSAPSIDAEPVKHGIWEPDWLRFECSLCHKWFKLDFDYSETPTASMNYCPNCGARMDGDVNEQKKAD